MGCTYTYEDASRLDGAREGAADDSDSDRKRLVHGSAAVLSPESPQWAKERRDRIACDDRGDCGTSTEICNRCEDRCI